MRSISGWPTNTDAMAPVARVVHRGIDREAESLSLTRTLPSSFHEQVVGLGGIPQATGRITWASPDEAATAQRTAFNRVGDWPPKTRDWVDVYTGYRTATGDAIARQLAGYVKSSSGDPQASTTSQLVDPIDRLNRKVNLPPLQHIMPPDTDGGTYRYIGLFPTFFTDKFARAGGFNSTPPRSSGCVMSAPCMGSLWPEYGTISRATDFAAAGAPNWRVTPWTVGVCNAVAEYVPSGNSSLSRAMEITAMFDVSAGVAVVGVAWGGAELRLSATGGVLLGELVNNAGTTEIVRLTGVTGNVATLRIVPGGSTLTCTIRDSASKEATGTVAKPSESAGNADIVYIRSNDLDARVGGVQVAFPSSAWTAVDYTRSAFLTLAAHSANLVASPPIMDRTAKSLMEEQSQAELAAWWINGDGHLIWKNRDVLLSGSPAVELTSRDDLKNIQWEEDFAGVASTVEVAARQATVQRRRYSDLTLWEASASGVDKGDTNEQLIHPDSDSDWVDVDRTIALMDLSSLDVIRAFNRGRGSWIALYAENEAGTASGWAAAMASCSLIDYQTYKVTYEVIGYTEAGWEYSLKIPAEGAAGTVAGPMRRQPGLSTPVLRGKAKTMWADARYIAVAGPSDAPVLSHDCGWWVQDGSALQSIANLLAAQTTTPQPVLRNISIVPDSRIELGDIVTLTDADLTNTRWTCLTVGMDETMSAYPISWDMTATFRVLSTASI